MLADLAAGSPYLHDGLLMAATGALFFCAAALGRSFLKRAARRVPADRASGVRDLAGATRGILVPSMTLAGVYIAFRAIARHHPERYQKILLAELSAGF